MELKEGENSKPIPIIWFPPPRIDCPGWMIVRDPLTRAQSAYTMFISNEGMTDVKKDCASTLNIPSDTITFQNFCEYCLESKNRKWENTNVHLVPQTMFSPKMPNTPTLDWHTDITYIKLEGDFYSQIKEFYLRNVNEEAFVFIDKRIDEFKKTEEGGTLSTIFRNQAPHPFKGEVTGQCIRLIHEAYDRDYEILGY